MKKIIVLLFAIILGAVGVVGWRYGQTRHALNKSSEPDVLTDTEDRINNQPATDVSEQGAYFVVKDWGIRFPLAEGMRNDLLSRESNGDASGSIIFASKRLNALMGDSSCDLIKQPDGSYSGGIQASLVRIDPRLYPADSLKTYEQQLTFIKELDGFAYYARKQTRDPPVTCLVGRHEEHSAVEQDITNQLNAAFKRIEPTN